jgi:hypothetical protein
MCVITQQPEGQLNKNKSINFYIYVLSSTANGQLIIIIIIVIITIIIAVNILTLRQICIISPVHSLQSNRRSLTLEVLVRYTCFSACLGDEI